MAKIDFFLKASIERRASDLHFSSGEPPRLRIDGELEIIDENSIDNEVISEMLFELISEDEKEKLLSQRNLDKSISVPGIGNFRLNILFTRKGISAVLRTIPVKIPTLEDLGLPPVIIDLCNLDKGLVLITGPTGSGKSTTLAAMVNQINTQNKSHILTIEDPVEFIHTSKKSLVNQREIGGSCKSFADALKNALREDPDVILIGEMRDLETIALALTAAETGHLVFGTLHTRGAGSSVDRIIDSFPANQQAMIRTMLAESLKAVVSQTLLKKASGSGRVAAYEIMVVNTAISNLIREGKTFQIPSAIQVGRKSGMITMDQSMVELVGRQEVKPEEVTPLMENPNLIDSVIRNMAKGSKPPAKPLPKVAQAQFPSTPIPSSGVSEPKPTAPSIPVETLQKIVVAPPKITTVPPKIPMAPKVPSAPKPNVAEVSFPKSMPPLTISKVSLQDSFKSLMEDDSNDDLLSDMEIITDENKKTG